MTFYSVSSGQAPLTGLVLSGGDQLIVGAGGIAIGTAVSSGGSAYISSGGAASAGQVFNGGAEYVYAGGASYTDDVLAGGVETVSGSAFYTSIGPGGTAIVVSGGFAQSATISAGGALLLSAGSAAGTTVSAAGALIVLPGAAATGTDQLAGGLVISTGVVEDRPGSGFLSAGSAVTGLAVTSGSNLYVLSGGTATSATLSGYSYFIPTTIQVFSGGSALATQIGQHGIFTVAAGGIASGTIVSLNGEINVYGKDYGTVLSSGGVAFIGSGGVDYGLTDENGVVDLLAGGVGSDTKVTAGTETVLPGGFAIATSVTNGQQVVFSQGMASGTLLGSGGYQQVFGSASLTSIGASAVAAITSTGISYSAAILSGGEEVVSSGGIASASTVNSGGTLIVLPGGSATGTSQRPGGQVISTGILYQSSFGYYVSYVAEPGNATFLLVSGGAEEFVLPGGAALSNTINDAFQVVYSGGSTISTLVVEGDVIVSAGGTTTGTVLAGSGEEQISGGIAYATTLSGYGTIRVVSGLAAGTDVQSGGHEYVESGGIAANTTLAGGTLVADTGGTLTGGITFTGAGGVLMLDSTAMPGAVISGFAPGDEIDLAQIPYSTGESVSVTSPGIVTISAGGTSYGLDIAGATLGDPNFQLGPDTAETGLALTEAAACFCAGTRIATLHGELPVQHLAIGDLVKTLHAGPRQIKWIGRRRYHGRFIAGNHLALPICIKAGAIADHIPARDLFVSPGHAILVHGALIPAWRLINAVSITQAAAVELVEYFHIELQSHDIIFAENCPSETFHDENFRNRFENAAEFYATHPQPNPIAPGLPRLEHGFRLQAIATRLARRAGIATPQPRPGPLRGHLSQTGPAQYTGWAQNLTAPETPVPLTITQGGIRIARILANAYHADLPAAGIGSVCHGFTFSLPPGSAAPSEPAA